MARRSMPWLFAAPLAGALLGCVPMPELRPVLVQGEAAAPEPVEDDYTAGKRHLAVNELGLAIGRFRAAVARNPSDVAALNALAACYDRLGRFDLADRYYHQALALAPDDAQSLNNAGLSQLLRGRAHQAVALLDRARRAAPGDATVQANLDWARSAEVLALAAEPAAEERPSRVQRVARNAWALTLRSVARPVSLLRPLSPDGAEPPPPLHAPRPAVVQLAPVPLPQAEAPAPAGLRVLNGVGRRGMAARMRGWLAARGWSGGSIGDAAAFTATESVLTHRPDRAAEAARLAALLPPGIRLKAVASQRHDLVLMLGRDLLPFDHTLADRGAR